MTAAIIIAAIVVGALHIAMFVQDTGRHRRAHEVKMRDMAVRHARERAALTAWRIEVEHHLRDQ